MHYSVRQGDSLSSIAAKVLGHARLWPAIAHANRLAPPFRLMVGDVLILPAAGRAVAASDVSAQEGDLAEAESLIPGRAFLFILADEVNPATRKVVRKVMVNPRLAAQVAARIGQPVSLVPNPEMFGLHPTNANAQLPPGRHALGMKPSPYLSASEHAFGAPRFSGNRFWIDVARAKAAGATIHETHEILGDLDRIAKKAVKPEDVARIERYKSLIAADAEVLVKGPIPAAAVKGGTSMALTRGLQGVQVIGFAMTAIDLGIAGRRSVQRQSLKPIVAEGTRQIGGWAGAWAGIKLGGWSGALVGIETGPGAIVTGAIGAVVGGVTGYMAFDYLADGLDPN